MSIALCSLPLPLLRDCPISRPLEAWQPRFTGRGCVSRCYYHGPFQTHIHSLKYVFYAWEGERHSQSRGGYPMVMMMPPVLSLSISLPMHHHHLCNPFDMDCPPKKTSQCLSMFFHAIIIMMHVQVYICMHFMMTMRGRLGIWMNGFGERCRFNIQEVKAFGRESRNMAPNNDIDTHRALWALSKIGFDPTTSLFHSIVTISMRGPNDTQQLLTRTRTYPIDMVYWMYGSSHSCPFPVVQCWNATWLA